ncbi:MAG: HD domain-containing protein [Deltaproteobacteria bacterium]|nr:HD domain-containing protein [Deltaproteobacteria bacterium]
MYSERFDEAVALAVRDFRHKVRKDTQIPYVTHLFAVASMVGEHGGDEDQMIAAILHDWLEDIKGAEPAHLEVRFGSRVRALVEGLSDSFTHPKPPWKERKLAYIAKLALKPPELKLISAADKLHNCTSIRRDYAVHREAVWGRFTGGRDGTLWYYREVARALADGWDHPLAHRLHQEVRGLWQDAATVTVDLCKTGVQRHAPDIADHLLEVGARAEAVECFDKCDLCERFLLARIDGIFTKFRHAQELVDAVEILRAE